MHRPEKMTWRQSPEHHPCVKPSNDSGPSVFHGMDIHVVSMDVETIAVIKKNKKYNTKGCVKVMQELS